jgi:hypothetical protein
VQKNLEDVGQRCSFHNTGMQLDTFVPMMKIWRPNTKQNWQLQTGLQIRIRIPIGSGFNRVNLDQNTPHLFGNMKNMKTIEKLVGSGGSLFYLIFFSAQ